MTLQATKTHYALHAEQVHGKLHFALTVAYIIVEI